MTFRKKKKKPELTVIHFTLNLESSGRNLSSGDI